MREDLRKNSLIRGLFRATAYMSVCRRFIAHGRTYSSNNGAYSHEYWLKKYSGWKGTLFGLIEHGLHFGKNVAITKSYGRDFACGNILTFGDYRKDALSSAFPDHNIVCIGPYIHYAKTDTAYLNEIRSQLRAGKTLTVFPAHSITGVKAVYSHDRMWEIIQEVNKTLECTNIVMCMFIRDMSPEACDYYKKKGCIITTAGESCNSFYPRLRAILESSDYTLSNELGTNIGYSIYFDKPCFVVSQEIRREGSEKALFCEFALRGEHWKAEFERERELFFDVFSIKHGASITEKQRDVAEYYWGLSKIMTPEKLRCTLDECRAFYIRNAPVLY